MKTQKIKKNHGSILHDKAILFDLDGVLIETEKETFLFYQDYLKVHYGIILPDSAFAYKIGRKSTDFWKDVLTKKERNDVNVEKLTLLKRKLFIEHPEKYVKKVSGVKQLLKTLKASGYKLALTTQNEKEMMDAVLNWLGIRNFFNVILNLQDISQKKPNPEIYLKAASLLNVSPKKCIVVEDSYDGIRAARRAHMICIAIQHLYSPLGSTKHADVRLKKLSHITASFLKKITEGEKLS
ncbi:MAG: HAD family phosphatase [Patescibacteria group bacterium]